MIMQLIAAFGETLVTGWGLTGATQIHSEIQPNVAVAIHQLTGVSSGTAVKGKMQKDGYRQGQSIVWSTGTDWAVPNSGWGTVYVRLTATSNTMDSSSHAIDGSTWHVVTEDVTNVWFSDDHDNVIAETASVTIEIATDSGGTNIVATGVFDTNVWADV